MISKGEGTKPVNSSSGMGLSKPSKWQTPLLISPIGSHRSYESR